jgi:CHAT domain-containing protein
VIGTLWEANDKTSAIVAECFYTALRSSSGTLDTSQSALAIHHAVRQYRDGFGRKAGAAAPHPLLWGAYLHAGA